MNSPERLLRFAVSTLVVLTLLTCFAPGRAADRAVRPEGPNVGDSHKPGRMSIAPAPSTGSMPTGPAPVGKLGTAAPAKGKLGTEPSPSERQSPPPRIR